MYENFVPKIKVEKNVVNFEPPEFVTSAKPSSNVNPTEKTGGFSEIMGNMIDQLDETVKAPDSVMQDMLTGQNGTDIHDVMIAMSKAELGVNIATQVTTKVIQAYEKIMSIQV